MNDSHSYFPAVSLNAQFNFKLTLVDVCISKYKEMKQNQKNASDKIDQILK